MPQPSIKLPRNGGPLICFKHNALIDMILSRKKELEKLGVGRLWWNDHTGYEVNDWKEQALPDQIHPQWLITNQTQSLYTTMLVVLRSCLRDGKRMEKALKVKNSEIVRLTLENEKLRRLVPQPTVIKIKDKKVAA